MYRNLGHKIKLIAKVCRWVLFGLLEAAGLAGLVISGVYGGSISMALAGTAVMALGPLLAWLSSLLLYTLGHLVENSDIRTDLAVRQYKLMTAVPAPAPAPVPAPAPAPVPAGYEAYAPDAAYYASTPGGYTGSPYTVDGSDSPYGAR